MTPAAMLILIIALQLLDIATTHHALKTGIGHEANPVLNRLFSRYGHKRVLFTIKGAFVLWLVYFAPHIVTLGYDWVLWAIAAVYVAVIINNARVIWRASRGQGHTP